MIVVLRSQASSHREIVSACSRHIRFVESGASLPAGRSQLVGKNPLMTTQNNPLRLRGGATNPVILLISREAVDACDVERVFKRSIRFLMASREDVILYRLQVSIV